MTPLRALCSAIAGAVLVAGASAAGAQPWPTRAIQVISPFTAGSANEVVARIVLDQGARQIGRAFVVENRPGGGGTIGAAMVANADPDGYTLLLHSSSLSSQVVLHKTLPYDPVRDFAPVSLFGIQPSVLVAAPSRVSRRLPTLLRRPRQNPAR
jgi:tripartite-type tricarboxylate transporter receptor subunit TctC